MQFLVGAVVYYGLLFVVTWLLVSNDVASSPLGIGSFSVGDLIIAISILVGGYMFVVEWDNWRNVR